jgi:hypothetical protein
MLDRSAQMFSTMEARVVAVVPLWRSRDSALARSVMQVRAKSAHRVVSFPRFEIERIVRWEPRAPNPPHDSKQAIGQPEQRLVHLPGLLGRKIVAVHHPASISVLLHPNVRAVVNQPGRSSSRQPRNPPGAVVCAGCDEGF